MWREREREIKRERERERERESCNKYYTTVRFANAMRVSESERERRVLVVIMYPC